MLGMFSSGTCDLTSHVLSEFEWTEAIQKIPRAPALWVLAMVKSEWSWALKVGEHLTLFWSHIPIRGSFWIFFWE